MPITLIAAADDSPASLQAVRLIAGYAGERDRLAVIVLNVQRRPLTLWPGPAFDAGAIEAALLHKGQRQLAPARSLLSQAGIEAEAAVRLGVPAESIGEEALRRGAAAVVIGTRGHGALRGFALGSVAMRVAHRAQAPTFLVQPDTVLPRALGRNLRVLVPLDGSPHATRAVSLLLAWQDWLGSLVIDLVHVRPSADRLDSLLPAPNLPEQLDSEEVERATRDARALIHVARLGHRLHETAGDPSEEIVRLAGGLGSELIFMGTRGLGAVHHALIGSVALKVAHLSPVPVLLVP